MVAEELYKVARSALKKGEDAGADEIEVFCISGRSKDIETTKNEINLASESFERGIGTRVLVGGAIGFSSTSDLKKIDESVIDAIGCARANDSGNDWKSLPSNGKYPSVSGVYDKRIDNLTVEECLDFATDMINGAKTEKVYPTSGSFSCVCFSYLIMNSNGVEVTRKETMMQAYIESMANEGNEVSTAYDFAVSRNLDCNFFELGQSASKQAFESLNGTKISPHKTTVLFRPFAISDILQNAFVPSISAENVQKNRSSLADKIGQKIASCDLSILDDGLIDSGIGTSPSDDEGVPSQRTKIIENGELKSFLYDHYTSQKEERKSTGNATRGSYSSLPSIGIRNMILTHPTSDLIGETKEGVLITSVIGGHTANAVSGDFSLEGRGAFIIKDGCISKPIKQVMISGNVFDLIKKIDGLDTDTRMIGNVITPTIRVRDLKVVG